MVGVSNPTTAKRVTANSFARLITSASSPLNCSTFKCVCVSKIILNSPTEFYLVAPFKNGLLAISSCNVVGSPCPGKTTVFPGNGNKYCSIPAINVI